MPEDKTFKGKHKRYHSIRNVGINIKCTESTKFFSLVPLFFAEFIQEMAVEWR